MITNEQISEAATTLAGEKMWGGIIHSCSDSEWAICKISNGRKYVVCEGTNLDANMDITTFTTRYLRPMVAQIKATEAEEWAF